MSPGRGYGRHIRTRSRLGDGAAGRVISLACGVPIAAGFAVTYLPQLIDPLLANALGLRATALAGLPLLANLGFACGLLGQFQMRHWRKRVPPARSAMLLASAATLAAMALAPAVWLLGAAAGLAGAAGSVGVLLKSEAVLAQQARRRSGAGAAIGGVNLTFIVTLSMILLAPSVLPGDEPAAFAGLAPVRWLLIVLAAVMVGAWVVLPGLLQTESIWSRAAAGSSLRDPSLWRSTVLTALNAASAAGPETAVVSMFLSYGAAHPVAWASYSLMSILPAGIAMAWWGRSIDRRPRTMELISLTVTLVGELVGAASASLHGTVAIAMLAAAFPAIEFGTVATWESAEATAVAAPTDLGRIAVVTGGRVAMRAPLVALAALGAGSDVMQRIWLPSIALSLIALGVWSLTRRLRRASTTPQRRGMPTPALDELTSLASVPIRSLSHSVVVSRAGRA